MPKDAVLRAEKQKAAASRSKHKKDGKEKAQKKADEKAEPKDVKPKDVVPKAAPPSSNVEPQDDPRIKKLTAENR